MHLALLGLHITRPNGRVGAGVGDDDRVLFGVFAQLIADDLRFHRHRIAGAFLLKDGVPILHTVLRFFEELAVLVSLEQRQKQAQRLLRITHQTHIHGRTQSDALRIRVDLHALHCPGFGRYSI